MAVKNSKPKPSVRKPRQQRPLCTNPMRVAMSRMAVLTPDERRVIMVPTKAALERLRVGACNQENWEHLASAANIGLELSYLGIASDAESVAILTRMLLALGEICKRVNAGGSFTPRDPELVAISEGVERHDIQLLYASALDLQRACRSLEASKEAARAGRLPSLTLTKKEPVAA